MQQAPAIALSPADMAKLPTDADVAFYQEHGYWFSPPILPEALIDAAAAGQERFYRGERDAALPVDWDYNWTPAHGNVLRKNDYSSFQIRELAALVRHPLIAACAARLAGTPSIRLWHDQLLYKPPERGDARIRVGWHTDHGYWKTCSSQNMITAWVPFHDCDEAIGSVTMIAGSHRWPDNNDTRVLNFWSADLDAQERQFATGGRPVVKAPAIIRKGCISFHHCLTIHGSGPNRTDRARRSMAIHLQDEGNRWVSATFPSGKPATHPNDQLCRRDADGHPDYADPAWCPRLFPA